MPYASLVIIFNDKNKVLLLKRSQKVDTYRGLWGFPGGKIEDGETSVDAAVREVSEETGLEVYQKKLVYVFTMIKEPYKHIVFFLTNEWSGSPRVDWESDEFGWFDPSELSDLNMVPAPKIVFDMIESWAKFNSKSS
jgi:8-oxo-dGTP diphosphatase